MCECYFCNNNKNVIEPKCNFLSDGCHCASCVLERYNIDVNETDVSMYVECMECHKIFKNAAYIEDNDTYVKVIEEIIKHTCCPYLEAVIKGERSSGRPTLNIAGQCAHENKVVTRERLLAITVELLEHDIDDITNIKYSDGNGVLLYDFDY